MTLIATLQVRGAPALVGDVMLSRRGSDEEHFPLPTINPAQVLCPNEDWKVAGVHRKICIVNPHLAVGWTGRLDIAAHLISGLLDVLGDRLEDLDPDLLWRTLDDSWANCVRSAQELEDADITLLGWLIDKEDYINAFEWAKERKILHGYNDVIAIGSGATDFLELVNSSGPVAQGDDQNLTARAMDLVSLVACLLGREFGTGANIRSYYGGGYDIVLLTEDGFRFLDSILYVPVVIENIEADSCQAIQPTFFLKFSYSDENLLILRRTIRLDNDGCGIDQETEIWIIGRFGATKKDLEQINIESHLSLTSSIVSLIFMAKTERIGCIYAPFVGAGNSEHFSFEKDKLRISMEVTKKMIPLMHDLATGS